MPLSPLPADLLPAHRPALQQALDLVHQATEPIGIVVTGSIVRGNPGPSSDLDIVVLHAAPWRRRIQRFCGDTPVELFINPAAWLSHAMRDEASQGRPVMAHMLATGVVIADTGGAMAAQVARARAVLAGGPGLSADALERDRYAAACQVEDALDFGDADTPDARRMRALAVEAVLRHAWLQHDRFLPRPKERLARLADHAPAVALDLATVLSAPPVVAQAALVSAAQAVLGTAGFFEWDSGPDPSLPPARA